MIRRLILISLAVFVTTATILYFVIYGVGRVSESDFSLEITVSSQTFYQGEDIEVRMVFRNSSGRRLKILYNRPLMGASATNVLWIQDNIEHPPITEGRLLFNDRGVIARNETVRVIEIGGNLEPGEYRIRAGALFSQRFRNVNIHILSNSIYVTVLKN